MNVVFEAARAAVQDGWLMGLMTLVFMAAFLGWTAWAWWPGNRVAIDAAARLPLDDEPDVSNRTTLGSAR